MELTPLKYFESLFPANTREEELHAYTTYIKSGGSAQIVGIPGVGKSNVLRLLAYNKDARTYHFKNYEKMMHFVYMDSSEVKDKSLADISKFILFSLSFSLGERRLIEESNTVNDFLKEGVSFNDELLLFQNLKKSIDYLSIEKKMYIVLLFDKFDTLIPNITSQFFTNLRILRNHAKYRFGAVFSLTRPFEESIDTKIMADFHDLVSENEIYVSLYDKVGIEFRLDYIERIGKKEVDKNLRREILKLTGGHAKLTKLCFEAVINTDKNIVDLKSFLLNKTSLQEALYEIWNAFLPEEQKLLKENVEFDEAVKDFKYLAHSRIISQEGISIPIFKDYIENIDININKKLSYDNSRNEILLGEEAITDRLSSLELKLLRFLIDNQDKVSTKDEIISAVWSNQKTQEGVTDQALDQIFYRLRKKVEIDPKNPKLVRTIKGVGYKLIND